MKPFHEQLDQMVKKDDIQSANRILMRELGKSLVKSKSDFVALLQASNIEANEMDTDASLINKFIENAHKNKKLLLGASLLVNTNNKVSGFDGDEISDESVKSGYKTMYVFFDAAGDEDEGEMYCNAGGLGAITGAIGKLTDVGGKAIDTHRAKTTGASDALQKQQQARQELTKAVLDERQKELDIKKEQTAAKSKTTKTLLIVGGIVLGIAVLGTVIYMVKRKK